MLKENFSLKDLNTFGLNVKTKFYYPIYSQAELDKVPAILDQLNVPYMVLGGGSNVLFTKDYEGIILHNLMKGIEKIDEGAFYVKVASKGGENWHTFVLHCIKNEWGGVENLSLIPGNVGAAPIQNIGAYGVEIKDIFEQLTAFELTTGKRKVFYHEDCEFGYRDSVFKRHEKGKYLIEEVIFKLTQFQHQYNTTYGAIETEIKNSNDPKINLKNISDAVIKIRKSKLPDPQKIGNAGSFFKNPVVKKEIYTTILHEYPDAPCYTIDEEHVKVPAGWLIEKAGWKGKDFGGYGIHEKQALVLVNRKNANGIDLYNLSSSILEDIQKKFGILLEREVNIIE